MKIERKVDAGLVASSGAVTTSAFSIATSSHMFNILSSGLYADKIKAVIREIGCNAVDAHIMAGKADVPIVVKLPNQLDATFYVKDFGPGLDEDEIRQLYTTYGWSSKQDSDEVTGAFGLGCKSPFAYTHTFTVVSSKNGRMLTMTAHQDEEGKPVITKIAETDSPEDWPSGVMVTLAVAPSDFQEFETKARAVFRWFTVKPQVLGSAITLEEPQYDFRWKNYGMSKDSRGVSVIIGNVRYPVDIKLVREKCKLEGAAAGMLERTLTIWLPLGSAMMTPSRESLEYTKKTVETLRAVLTDAAQTLHEAVYEILAQPASSPLAMHRRVYSLRECFPSSVRASLDAVFHAAPVEQQKLLNETWFRYINRIVPLEHWVGEGAQPRPEMQQVIVTDGEGAASRRWVPVEGWKPYGARVFAIVVTKKTKRSAIRAAKREIVGGRYVNTVDDAQKLNFDINSVPPVYVLDSGLGISALKLHFEETTSLTQGSERVAALVVVGSGRDARAKATVYAERLMRDCIAFGESVPLSVETAIPDIVARVRRGQKRYASKTRADWLAQSIIEASLTTPAASSDELLRSVTTFEEFEDANSEKLYLVAYKTKVVKYRDGDELAIDKLAKAIRNGVIGQLREIAGIESESVILLENKAQLRALRLEESGYRNFFDALFDAVRSDPEKQEQLASLLADPLPGLNYHNRSNDSACQGLVAELVRQRRKKSVVWERLSQRYPEHPVIQAAISYAAQLNEHGVVADQHRLVRCFVNECHMRSYFGVNGKVKGYAAFFDAAHASVPHWEILDLDKLSQMAVEDGETVATLLDVVFLLGPNLTQAAGLAKKAA